MVGLVGGQPGRSAQQTRQQGNQSDADQGNTAARDKLLDALAFGSRVILPVPLQQIDAAPNTQRTAEAHNDGLQSSNRAIEKFHKFTSIISDCDVVLMEKSPVRYRRHNPQTPRRLTVVQPIQHGQRIHFSPCFTHLAVYFQLHLLRLLFRRRGIVFCDPPAHNRSGNDSPVDFFLCFEIIRKCQFIRVFHNRSLLSGRRSLVHGSHIFIRQVDVVEIKGFLL